MFTRNDRSESDKWRKVFRYLTMLDSWRYSSDEKQEILDKTASFMTENIDSITDLEDAYREISRFFISSVKREHGEDFEDFDAAIHFVENYINKKNLPVADIGGSDEISSFRRFKFDSEKETVQGEESDPLLIVEHICRRFHLIAQQLKNRHDNRHTLEITDEYDVQDLLHVLLRIHFDDVRPEEYTPSYAGGSSRMDFLLKEERIIIEVKKTRDGLGPREVGDQLLVDMERYKEHPDCETLLCFIYDPEGRISNPRGLENDLAKKTEKITTKALIVPKGY